MTTQHVEAIVLAVMSLVPLTILTIVSFVMLLATPKNQDE